MSAPCRMLVLFITLHVTAHVSSRVTRSSPTEDYDTSLWGEVGGYETPLEQFTPSTTPTTLGLTTDKISYPVLNNFSSSAIVFSEPERHLNTEKLTLSANTTIATSQPAANFEDQAQNKVLQGSKSLEETKSRDEYHKQIMALGEAIIQVENMKSSTDSSIKKFDNGELLQSPKQADERLEPINESKTVCDTWKSGRPVVSNSRAYIFGVYKKINTVVKFNGPGTQNPDCLELHSITVTSIDTLYSCVRLFSSPECTGKSTAYYPGNEGRVQILGEARSVGPCMKEELDEITLKYVQYGSIIVVEYTKTERNVVPDEIYV